VTEERESRAIGALLLGAVGIAFAPIFVRFAAAQDIGPSAAAFWRLAIAAPIAWIWVWRSGRLPANSPDKLAAKFHWDWRLCLPGVFFAADLSVWHWSIHWTSVANATLLANFQPLFVTLAGWLFWRRKVKRLFLVGMFVALSGAVLLVGESDRQLMGDLLGLLTAVFYASYFLSASWLREKYSTPLILAYAVTVAALLVGPVAIISGEPLFGYSARGWFDVAALAVVSQIVGQGLILFALAHLPASFSAVTLLLQPVIAALLAWWLFAEAPAGRQAVGGVIVLVGILVARRGSGAPSSQTSSAPKSSSATP
jgi:drug/metabolite transporter (DMT)-like permease